MIFLGSALAALAQEIAITVDAPETVAAGDRFRLVYSVNSAEGRFQPPAFDPSFSVSGPQSSTSRNIQWVNGDMTSVSTTTLVYYLVASKTGRFTIPPAQYTTKKETISSAPVEIEVTASGAIPSAEPEGEQQQAVSPSEVSLRLILTDTEVYVGQPVSATLKIYTRINLSGLNELKYPDFKGFLREDIETPPLRSLQSEVIDGVQYGTGIIQKFVLFPQVAGEITIDPVQITALVQQRTAVSDPFFNDPFFNDFFSNVQTVPRTVASAARVIVVKPLPSPQPSDFHGAVGSFEIASSLNKKEVAVNDAMTYTVTLKGNGNLSLAGAPAISFPQGIERYDPKISIRSTGPGSGSKSFEYLLIPRNRGSFDIPPLSYTCFDIRQGKYVTLRAEGFTINVLGDSTSSGAAAAQVINPGEDVKYLGQDIRFIRNENQKLRIASDALVGTVSYWLWFVISFVLAAAVLLVRREHIRRSADVAGVRNRKAAGVARRRLAKAQSLLGSGKAETVNEEIARALWGYLGDKLGIPLAEMTRENCFAALNQRSVSEEMVAELDSVLTACEYSRYSPSGKNESPGDLLKRAGNMIRNLENLL